MYELTPADMIWNRACGPERLHDLPGDRALADLLQAHGLAMNGGVLHAVECLSANQLSAAEAGYRLFGLDAAASLLSHAKHILESDQDLELHERELDRRYADIIPDDSALVERFEKHLAENPSQYAPLRPVDMT